MLIGHALRRGVRPLLDRVGSLRQPGQDHILEGTGRIVDEQAGKWGFLTPHAPVLPVIARDSGSHRRVMA
ncbi:hypothetical protein ACGFX8_23340 [Streptomyces sp. NPDC048362]|uniref:hypothetical protein n=1 Tax=Streptomyces sp. NPDC048362 TaxID=3365539 RepID=UPI00371AC4F5